MKHKPSNTVHPTKRPVLLESLLHLKEIRTKLESPSTLEDQPSSIQGVSVGVSTLRRDPRKRIKTSVSLKGAVGLRFRPAVSAPYGSPLGFFCMGNG